MLIPKCQWNAIKWFSTICKEILNKTTFIIKLHYFQLVWSVLVLSHKLLSEINCLERWECDKDAPKGANLSAEEKKQISGVSNVTLLNFQSTFEEWKRKRVFVGDDYRNHKQSPFAVWLKPYACIH